MLRAAREPQPRTLRALAREIGVEQSYLSRVTTATTQRRQPSRELLEKIARAFGLPADYFPEFRASIVVDAARENPALLDPVYRRLQREISHQ